MNEPESIILCEGYHDRAFLKGWLESRGCQSWKDKDYPPHGRELRGRGQYAYRSAIGRWLRVVPMKGDGNWQSDATFERDRRTAAPIEHVIVALDDDSGSESTRRVQSFQGWAVAGGAKATTTETIFELPAPIAPTRLALIMWRAPDPDSADLPPKQTLERLVCAAIAEAHPTRARYVRGWLAERPEAPAEEKLHKSFASSHMAGWYSDRGSQDFFDALWSDPAIAAALMDRLASIGAAEALAPLLA